MTYAQSLLKTGQGLGLSLSSFPARNGWFFPATFDDIFRSRNSLSTSPSQYSKCPPSCGNKKKTACSMMLTGSFRSISFRSHESSISNVSINFHFAASELSKMLDHHSRVVLITLKAKLLVERDGLRIRWHALRTAFESGSQPFGYAPAGLGEYGYVPPMRNITYDFYVQMVGKM